MRKIGKRPPPGLKIRISGNMNFYGIVCVVLALAEVRNAACLSCHMQIPHQLYNEIRRCDRIITCPNCLRILFFSGKPEAAKE